MEATTFMSLIYHQIFPNHEHLLCSSDSGFSGSGSQNKVLCLAHHRASHSEIKQTQLVLHLIYMTSYTFARVDPDTKFLCYIPFVLWGTTQSKQQKQMDYCLPRRQSPWGPLGPCHQSHLFFVSFLGIVECNTHIGSDLKQKVQLNYHKAKIHKTITQIKMEQRPRSHLGSPPDHLPPVPPEMTISQTFVVITHLHLKIFIT